MSSSGCTPAQAGAQVRWSNSVPLRSLRAASSEVEMRPSIRGSRQARIKRWVGAALALVLTLILAHPALAQAAPTPLPGGGLDRALKTIGGTGQPLSLSLQILLLMSLLTVLPSLVLMMTSFTRIIIVLSILRQALGLQQTPPNQVLVGLTLFLSLFVMRPAIDQINATAYKPLWRRARSRSRRRSRAIGQRAARLHDPPDPPDRSQALRRHGIFEERCRRRNRSGSPASPGPRTCPSRSCCHAFVTSELKTAFQIGFLIFLPFLIIDLVVASTLMALGMMMLSPTIISMPFKLLLFVLVDGWALTMGSLAASFQTLIRDRASGACVGHPPAGLSSHDARARVRACGAFVRRAAEMNSTGEQRLARIFHWGRPAGAVDPGARFLADPGARARRRAPARHGAGGDLDPGADLVASCRS